MDDKLPCEFAPLISVVMPVYNSATYLYEAIESVLSQTLSDFELIIIYDESNDGSISIINQFQRNDSRVKLIYGNNERLIGALNQGVDVARGKFIARMDADDISLPERFEKQVQLMESAGADICGCHFVVIGQSGMPFSAKTVPLTRSAFIIYLACTVPFAHGSVMMRTSFVKKHALKYNKNICSAEDYDLWINFFENNAVFVNVDLFLFKYRETSDSLSKIMSKETAIYTNNLRKGYLLRNQVAFLEAVNDLIKCYERLSLDERKFLLISSYLAFINLRTLVFFNVMRRSSPVSIALFIFNWLKGI